MTDKTKSKTYNFLLENKTIEDILNQANISLKEKRRHGGLTYKMIETNNTNNQLVDIKINDDLSENEIFYDALDDLNNISTNEISQTQTIIQEQAKEIQQLKKQINELKQSKQGSINFDNFKYNAITIYDKNKSIIKWWIEKIHEEILPINNEIYFITTFQNTNQSITEEIICFHKLTNGNVEVIKQVKEYENINEYKDDFLLIEKESKQSKKYNVEPVSIKDFLKQQNDIKIKPSNKQWIIWGTFTTLAIVPLICAFLPFVWPVLALVFIDKIVISTLLVTIGVGSKIFSSLFSSITKKVESWISNKIWKNAELKEKIKKERDSIIKNLTSDKIETILETQFKILKQELDNRKNKNLEELINNNTINHNSNSLLENSTIESENNANFDSSIRNTVNHLEQQPSPISKNNWNKVKGLLTT